MKSDIRRHPICAWALTSRFAVILRSLAGATRTRLGRQLHKANYPLVLLIAVASITLLHKISSGSLPPFDDTTYALVSKTILKTGDWITMHWLDIPYLVFGKPPLNFWITALFYHVFGISELTARLSGVIHGVLGIVVVYFMGREMHSRVVGLIAAFFLLSLPDYFRLAQSAMLDVPVTCYITLSLLFYLLALRTRRLHYYCLFGCGFGLAIMTKSMVGLLPLLIISLFHLLLRDLKPLFTSRFATGVASGFLVCVPWHAIQYLRFGRTFISKYFMGTLSYNALDVLRLHRSPLGYYIHNLYVNEPVHLAIFLASLPLLAVMAIRGSRSAVFVLAHILVVFVLFTAMETRMTWYITPVYPAIAISSALLLARLQQVRPIAPAIALALVALFVFQMRVLWSTEHWYLRGDPALKQIILDFKSKSSERDVLFSYDIGAAINTGPFYGDRKVVLVIASSESFRLQQSVGDYVNAGLVLYIGNEDELIRWVQLMHGRHVLFRADTYRALKHRLTDLGAVTLSSNESFVIIRSS